jgi:hypothetical protein
VEVKEQLESVISRPIDSPEQAEVAQEAAELLATYLRVRDRTRRLMASAEDPRTEEASNGDLKGLPLHRAAELVLEEGGTPLHARELGARMKARGWRHPRSTVARPEQIVHQIAARLPKHPETFRRIAPQTFALTKWGDRRFAPSKRKPRLALFSGPGDPIGRTAGTSDEPITSEGTSWRSY